MQGEREGGSGKEREHERESEGARARERERERGSEREREGEKGRERVFVCMYVCMYVRKIVCLCVFCFCARVYACIYGGYLLQQCQHAKCVRALTFFEYFCEF